MLPTCSSRCDSFISVFPEPKHLHPRPSCQTTPHCPVHARTLFCCLSFLGTVSRVRLRRPPRGICLNHLCLLQQPVPARHRRAREHRLLARESGDHSAFLGGLEPQSGKESQPHPGKTSGLPTPAYSRLVQTILYSPVDNNYFEDIQYTPAHEKVLFGRSLRFL